MIMRVAFHFVVMMFGLLTIRGDSITQQQQDDDYILVIDGGSTGSRGFIIKFYGENKINVTQGKKITPGMSTFLQDTDGLGAYFEPIFADAANLIPAEYHSKTRVFILGTAGMRLLSDDQQKLIWEALYSQLLGSSFPFLLKRENLRTIDGKSEAYYAVIATNFIAGRIGIDLIPNGKLIGALDMGGSSTQLVFHMGTNENEKVHPDHFWSHSWLSFGAEKIQERVWHSLFENHQATSPSSEVILNPCLFKGHTLQYNGTVSLSEISPILPNFVIMEGTGEPLKCRELIQKTLWPHGCQSGGPCPVEDIRHPPVDGLFFGISVYFFALDCVRHYGQIELPHWPNPSIDELEVASFAFCEIPWEDISSRHQMDSHAMTNDEKLPNRCVEALYITTLLEDGFGFRGTHRGITLALEVDGTEVEWTLGFVLAEECLENRVTDSDVFSSTTKIDPILQQEHEQEQEQESNTINSEQFTTDFTTKKESTPTTVERVEDNNKSHPLKQYYTNTRLFVTQRIRSFTNFSQVSISHLSSLLVKVFHVITKRIQFATQLLIIKPVNKVNQLLTNLLLQFQHLIQLVVQSIHQRLPPSLAQFLTSRGVNSPQNSTSSPPPAPPSSSS